MGKLVIILWFTIVNEGLKPHDVSMWNAVINCKTHTSFEYFFDILNVKKVEFIPDVVYT